MRRCVAPKVIQRIQERLKLLRLVAFKPIKAHRLESDESVWNAFSACICQVVWPYCPYSWLQCESLHGCHPGCFAHLASCACCSTVVVKRQVCWQVSATSQAVKVTQVAWSPPGILKVLVLGSVSTPTACFLCLREVKPLGYMGSASR